MIDEYQKIKTPNELLMFMDMINYGYLSKSSKVYLNSDGDWYLEYILENTSDILTTMTGNCFDQTELERDWFTKNNYYVETYFEMINLNYKNAYPTHSFLIYKNNGNWYLFEHADYENKGIYEFTSKEELLIFQMNNYISYLKNFNISDLELSKVILRKFERPKKHIDAKEYLDYVVNSEIVNI